MKTAAISFSDLVENVYNLPLKSKEELANLLAHNIADTRRNEILENSKQAQAEHKAGKLKFSDSVHELKKML